VGRQISAAISIHERPAEADEYREAENKVSEQVARATIKHMLKLPATLRR
jgi:hypothetical protein